MADCNEKRILVVVDYHSTGGNHPKIVPNCVDFRYWGELQSIHPFDCYEVGDSPWTLAGERL